MYTHTGNKIDSRKIFKRTYMLVFNRGRCWTSSYKYIHGTKCLKILRNIRLTTFHEIQNKKII